MTPSTLVPTLVENDQLLATRRKVLSSAKRKRMVAITGPSGSGKTEAALDAARRACAELDLFQVHILTPRRLEPTVYTDRAIEAFGVTKPNGSGRVRDDFLVSLLEARPSLIVVDEAHRIGAPGLEQIQYLCERVRHCVVFVGVEQLGRLIDRNETLLGRTNRVKFKALDGDDLKAVLATMHDAYAALTDAAVRRMAKVFGRNLHNWKRGAETLEDLAADLGVAPELTTEMMTLVLREMS